ncbi:class I SAM-dependent RNA methyltransferase [Thermodesulfobacteriota bacterium]
MFDYQKNHRFFAQTAGGLEELAQTELQSLGAQDVHVEYRGLYFSADPPTLYRINYQSRLISRVFAPLIRFDCHSTKYLYKTAVKIKWDEILTNQKTFAISAITEHSAIKHSHYAALCLKDAVVDTFRKRYGKRPDVDKKNPDIRLHLFISNNKATISFDTSGDSLHKRGYRLESVEAPMQETLAAALVSLSNWDGTQPLYDPMCGSGTILCEALMNYCAIPSGFLRDKFGFESLPDFDESTWKKVKQDADAHIKPLPEGLISGSDSDAKSISAAKKNILNLRTQALVTILHKKFQDINPIQDSIIITNPPYGIRMGSKPEVSALMKEFGDFLKHQCTGSTAYVYFGDRELVKKIGLKPSMKKPLTAGGLNGLLARYEMY